MLAINRIRVGLFVSTLAVLTLAGCFDRANTSDLKCTKDKYCPDGYVCVGVQLGSPGECQKANDGGSTDGRNSDAPVSPDGTVVTDSSRGLDSPVLVDGPMTPIDGPAPAGDAPALVDTRRLPPDSAGLPSDAAPGEAIADSPAAPPDSTTDKNAVDQTIADSRDGSVAGPDVDASADLPIQTPETGGGCTAATDCPGPCQTCSSSRTCVPLARQDDPSGRCAGTCDATGTCKSKQGQPCQAVAGGCASGTTCSPDGYCCNTECTGSCQACDIPGFLGTCTPVASGNPHGNRASCGTDTSCSGTCAGKADGTCSYPTKNCGAGPTCSGPDKAVGQSTCANGACQTPTATACEGGFACTTAACHTTCQTSADCQADYFCHNQKCHSDVVSVALGSDKTCAALKDGHVMCWGEGYLGDGEDHTSPTRTPVPVDSLTNAQMVRSTSDTTCALTRSNSVLCWGGYNGQLGSGADTVSSTPAATVTTTGAPLTGIVSLHGGTHAFCAVGPTATYCWGKNAGAGQLGFPTPANPTSVLSATPLQGAPAFGLFAMGGSFQVAVQRARDLYAWGYNHNGTISSSSTGEFPAWDGQLSTTDVNVAEVAAGAFHACILYVTGEVQCWGTNNLGQSGNGNIDDDPIPGHKIAGFTATHLTAGNDFTCAQTSDVSNIACWGYNASAIISADSTTNHYYTVPTTVPLGLPTGLTVKEVVTTASASTVCTIVSDGSLMCWGDNLSLQTGTGQTSSFVAVPSFVQANW